MNMLQTCGLLTVADVEYVLDEAAKRGLSKSTLQGLRNAMSAVLNDAMRSLDLRSNVACLARLPEVAPRKAKASATLEEVGTLLSEAEGNEMYELQSSWRSLAAGLVKPSGPSGPISTLTRGPGN